MISRFLKFFRTKSYKVSSNNMFTFSKLCECGLARGSTAGTHRDREIKDKALSTNRSLVTSTFLLKIVINETLTTLLRVTTGIHNYDIEKPSNNRNAMRIAEFFIWGFLLLSGAKSHSHNSNMYTGVPWLKKCINHNPLQNAPSQETIL